jgi:monoamine oxidase
MLMVDSPHTPERSDAAVGDDQDPLEAAGAAPLTSEQLPPEVLAVPGEGLERRPQPAKRVVIIGAGMAGLVAGFELARQGHDPVILEAQNRVGGRV